MQDVEVRACLLYIALCGVSNRMFGTPPSSSISEFGQGEIMRKCGSYRVQSSPCTNRFTSAAASHLVDVALFAIITSYGLAVFIQRPAVYANF